MIRKTTKTLNNGVKIPMLGLGVFRANEGSETEDAVRWALETGYRHIDTASVYGNEKSVGAAIRDSGVSRDEIFLTSKLWNADMRQDRAYEAFEESLERLGTDYLDLYLIHWPVRDKYVPAWKVLEQIYKEGRVRAIGVSNFMDHHLRDILNTGSVLPVVNQVECHPRFSQEPLKAYLDEKGVAFESYSPLGGGSVGNLANDPKLKAIGSRYDKSAAQVIIRWHLQRDLIVIPKSVHQERIIENAAVFDFSLSPEDMAAIDAMNKDHRVGSHPDHIPF